MKSLVERLRAIPNAEVSEGVWDVAVRLNRPSGFRTVVVVVLDVLEWYANVYDTADVEVWRDWSDYLGYERNQDRAAEAIAMADDVEWFVRTISEIGGFRVWSEPVFGIFGFTLGRMRVAERLRDGRWQIMELSDVPEDESPPLLRERRLA